VTRSVQLLLLTAGIAGAGVSRADQPLPHFPPGAVWTQDVSPIPLKHPNSDNMIARVQALGGWGTGSTSFQIDFGMHVLQDDGHNKTVLDYSFTDPPDITYYLPDCEVPGLSFPVPLAGSIEAAGGYTCDNSPDGEDCHLLVVKGNILYESYKSNITASGLDSQCALKWDLTKVYPRKGRGEQCTSADAAGFPIAPLLINADEVWAASQVQGDLGHALRFTLPNPRMAKQKYVHPATHAGGPSDINANALPYGSRLRLKPGFNLDLHGAGAATPEGVRVILRTLKKYGMLLSDGGNVPLVAQDDTETTHKWDADLNMDSHSMFGVAISDFEVVYTGPQIALTYDCVRTPDDFIFIDGYDY
jgi:hypothetical protein